MLVRLFLKTSLKLFGAVVLLVLFVYIANVLRSTGYPIIASIVGGMGIIIFVLSLLFILFGVFLKTLFKLVGAVVLLVLFVYIADVLYSTGYQTIAPIVGWMGIIIFVLSLLYILLEPLVKAVCSNR